MNPLRNLINRNSGNTNLLGRIMGAMMSGQSPEEFLRSQVGNFPQLQGLDLSNLESTAKQLAQNQGKNIDEVVGKAQNLMNQ